MILAKKEDIFHKFQLLKLLTAIVDNITLSQGMYFKGGTCAAMADYLDRFSIDLDFDLKNQESKTKIETEIEKVIKNQDFVIHTKGEETLFYLLKYEAAKNQRNTLRLSVFEDVPTANDYKPIYLPEIDRMVVCQTIETMFANKLVAPIDRFAKHGKIAGRDIYDIHYFFSQGYSYKPQIIKERTKQTAKDYIANLIEFVERNVTEKILTEDLNALLPYEKFISVRKNLKRETLLFLRNSVQ